VAVHGCEPDRTVPTPLRAGATGAGSVLDYILVNDQVEVAGAWLAFDEAEGAICASDHYGLVADLRLR
jgi:endonuclease/exonuclease/phosphatase family metal-dependent hydrolase